MTPLWSICGMIWREERWSVLRGMALAVTVLAMGIALLGLSGWFILAAGAAGLAGLGAVFDVFRPSAAIRFLALGRTAARYGERLLTHDATLRALATLRLRLLRGVSASPFAQMTRFRSAQVLNRITADVDALDGIALRLAIPILAGCVTLAGTWLGLAWLVAPAVASWTVLSLVAGSAVSLLWSARASSRPSRLQAAAAQSFRVRLIDHLRGRTMLAFGQAHGASRDSVLEADRRARQHGQRLAAIERQAGAAISVSATISAAGALCLGAELARSGAISPAQAAIGFFAALALAEVVAPLRRGIAELGAMRDAARRVTRWLAAPTSPRPSDGPAATAPCGVSVEAATLCPPGTDTPVLRHITFRVAAGETLALTGRSGGGKTTLLNAIAGLSPVADGGICLNGRSVADWAEHDLRTQLGYLPQRSALVSGTIAENLRLAAPNATDDTLWDMLDRLHLTGALTRLGGLDARLGEGGGGLSGGETRRLALARVLLRTPSLLLLDEPTEGLDRKTAARVLQGIRQSCPEATIILAAHRDLERAWADRAHALP